MTEFELLADPFSGSQFRHMTFGAYRSLLAFDTNHPGPLAIAARTSGQPVGLALASVADKQATLLSVFVEPRARGQGLGTELVRRTTAACVERGLSALAATYMTNRPGTAPLERIFSTLEWSPPHTRMLVVHCSAESISPAPWFQPQPLPPGYEVVPWVNITTDEREEIRQSNARAPWIPDDLLPFDFEPGLEPNSSLALRVHGLILGWCLTHVVEDKLRFTCSYVRRDLQRLGRIVYLYRETVARSVGIGIVHAMWTVPVQHERMVNFARRHLQPYATFFGETRGVVKRLTDNARDT